MAAGRRSCGIALLRPRTMMNVCFNCGLYRADKVIDPEGPYAICPECGHKHPFRQLPLLIVAGASGVGKSTVCRRLMGRVPEVVVLEADILWRDAFNKPEDAYRDFFERWLRAHPTHPPNRSQNPAWLSWCSGLPWGAEAVSAGGKGRERTWNNRRNQRNRRNLRMVCRASRAAARPHLDRKGDTQ